MEEETTQLHQKRNKSTPNPADFPEVIPTLPPEIIFEVLSWVPVKHLLQFRCVCKSWRSLISNPHFVKTHLRLSSKNDKCSNHRLIFSSVPKFNIKSCPLYPVLNEPSVDATELDYPLKHPHKSVWIAGSCNGLLFLAIDEYVLCLWNPSTRRYKRLPNPNVKLRVGWFILYGLGYDESVDDYKLVGVFCSFHRGGTGDVCEYVVKVCTLRTNFWRRIDDFPGVVPLDDSGKFCNGALHWAASRDIGSVSSLSWMIISLDLAGETYGEVRQPSYREGDFDLHLGVLGERLCVLCNHRGTHADIWVMKDYGVRESWAILASIPYLTDPGNCEFYSVPLYVSKNGEILLELGSNLLVYDVKNNVFKYPEISNFDACLEANIYVESLVSPFVD